MGRLASTRLDFAKCCQTGTFSLAGKCSALAPRSSLRRPFAAIRSNAARSLSPGVGISVQTLAVTLPNVVPSRHTLWYYFEHRKYERERCKLSMLPPQKSESQYALSVEKSSAAPDLNRHQSVPNYSHKNVLTDAPVAIMIVGSMAVDLICTVPDIPHSIPLLYNSHPAKIRTSVGGVAHNVALAISYVASNSVRLVTALGPDTEGRWLREYAKNGGLDLRVVPSEMQTARSVAVHNKAGELVVAYSDMSIIECINEGDIRREIRNGQPRFLAFDGYLSPTSIKAILEERGPRTKCNSSS